MIRVVIVDDQELLRRSLAQIISTDPLINVVDMAENGEEAIEVCERHKPDVLLMDIEMPVMDGLSALKVIKEKMPEVKVVILTTFETRDNIEEAFVADADGYITKDIGPRELITLIRCVNYGLTVIHKSVKSIMVNKFKKTAEGRKTYGDVLNDSEVEVVRLIVAGKTNKEIAAAVNYTEGTIKNKVSRIYEKLNISDRLQLAVYAVENGID